jgi:hypothetical protein
MYQSNPAVSAAVTDKELRISQQVTTRSSLTKETDIAIGDMKTGPILPTTETLTTMYTETIVTDFSTGS